MSTLGYAVDAVDWSETALAEAAAEHGTAVRWLRLDIESDDGTPLHADGYDLITLRFVVPLLNSRARTLHALGRRLRPGGAIVVVTPHAADTPAERRRLALDEDELAELRTDWASTTLHDAGGLAFVILRDPCRTGTTTPRDIPRAAGTQGTPSGTGSVEHTAAASRGSIASLSWGATTARSSPVGRRSRCASPPLTRQPSKPGTRSSSTTRTAVGNSTSW